MEKANYWPFHALPFSGAKRVHNTTLQSAKMEEKNEKLSKSKESERERERRNSTNNEATPLLATTVKRDWRGGGDERERRGERGAGG